MFGMDNQATTQTTERETGAASTAPSADVSPSQPPTGAPLAAGSAPNQDERTLAAVSYVLLWLTGLIIFIVAKPEQRYTRWHAVQSIALGIVAVVLSVVFNMLGAMLAFGAPLAAAPFVLLGTLLWVGMVVLIVFGAIKAYQGQSFRLPVLADLADKYAEQPAAGQSSVPA